MSDTEQEKVVTDLSNPDVTTKYQTASGIANAALAVVIAACVPGADIATVCELGDNYMTTECGKLYNKKDKNGEKITKGVAFPTCISPNELAGHYSPLKDDSRIIVAGDILKIDLAAHIDGYAAAVAHTIIVGSTPVTGLAADCVQAAHAAIEIALRKIKVGGKSSEVTSAIEAVAAEFGVEPLQGIFSYEVKQHVMDSQKSFGQKNGPECPQSFQFGLNEVYGLDIVFTTGDGRTRETDLRTTVMKRSNETYQLKSQSGRQFISELSKHAPTLFMSLRQIEEPLIAKAGSAEARRHRLIEEFPIMKGGKGEVIAQFKYTVCLLPGGVKKVTGGAFNQSNLFVSEKTIQNEELKACLASSTNPKKIKKKAAVLAATL
jgi:curved DNA binding protein